MSGLKIDIGASNNASKVFKEVENDLDKLSRRAKNSGGGAGGMGNVKGGGFFGNLGDAKGKFLAGDMGGAIASVTKAIGLMGAVIGAAAMIIGKLISGASKTSERLDETSKATGFSTTALQALEDAAKRNGVPLDSLRGKLEKLVNVQNNIGDNKEAQEAFKRLGISLEEVAALNPDQLLKRIADGVKKTGDQGAAFKILGKGAAELRSTLKELADVGYGGLAVSPMLNLSNENIAAMDKIGDTITDWKGRLKKLGDKIGAGLATGALRLVGGQGAIDEATKKREEEMKIEEELAAATRARQVEEVNKANEVLRLKKESAKVEEDLQKQTQEISDKQEQAAIEQKQFENIREGLGRKRGDKIPGEKEKPQPKTTADILAQVGKKTEGLDLLPTKEDKRPLVKGLFDWRGDQTPEQVIGGKINNALDAGSIKDDKRKDKADERAKRRLLALARQADDAERRGVTPSARRRAARDAIAANVALQNAQQNIDKRKRDIEQAQLDSVIVQKEIRDNTAFLKQAIQIQGGG
jgi:hypothetical protein